MGGRCWTVDQCFLVALAGSSRCRPGCWFGHDSPPDPLASSRLRSSRHLPDGGLDRPHCGSANCPSTTGVPRLRFVERWGRVQVQPIRVGTVLGRTGVSNCHRCRLLLVLPERAARAAMSGLPRKINRLLSRHCGLFDIVSFFFFLGFPPAPFSIVDFARTWFRLSFSLLYLIIIHPPPVPMDHIMYSALRLIQSVSK